MEKKKEPAISEKPFQFGLRSAAIVSVIASGFLAAIHYVVENDRREHRFFTAMNGLDKKHHYQIGSSYDEWHEAIMFTHISSDEFTKLMKDHKVKFQDITCLHFREHCTLTRENFAAMAALPNLLVLTIEKGKDLRKEDIEPLRTSESLRDIVIEETPIPLAELKALFPNAEFVSKALYSFPGTRKSIEGEEALKETKEWEEALEWLEEQLKDMGIQREEIVKHVGACAEIIRDKQQEGLDKMSMERAREYVRSIKTEK